MMIGDPSVFAIESEISVAYESLSLMALGFFVLHIGGKRYGVCASDATSLGRAFESVEERIWDRGKHLVGTLAHRSAIEIALAYRCEFYGETQYDFYCELPAEEFAFYFTRREGDIVWGPGCDEAFDDSSYILLFDVDDKVRLIAFKAGDLNLTGPDSLVEPNSLSEAWLPAGCILWHLAGMAYGI
jgi:hypothetical protein